MIETKEPAQTKEKKESRSPQTQLLMGILLVVVGVVLMGLAVLYGSWPF